MNTTVLKEASTAFSQYLSHSDNFNFENETLKSSFVELIENIYQRANDEIGTDELVENFIPLKTRFTFKTLDEEDEVKALYNQFVNVYIILIKMLENYFDCKKDEIILNMLVKFLGMFEKNELAENTRVDFFDKNLQLKYLGLLGRYEKELDTLVIENFWNGVKSGKRLSVEELYQIREDSFNFFEEVKNYYKENEPEYYKKGFAELLQNLEGKLELRDKKQNNIVTVMIIASIIIIILLIVWKYNR